MAKRKSSPQFHEFAAMIGEVRDESDRGMALILTSWAQDALIHFLKSAMIADEKVIGRLFDGTAPLGTFSSEIDLAYAIGLFGRAVHEDLHTIREIRNQFAHTRNSISFSSQNIRDRCRNLNCVAEINSFTEKPFKRPRTQYLMALMILTGYFITASKSVKRAEWSQDSQSSLMSQMSMDLEAAIEKEFGDVDL